MDKISLMRKANDMRGSHDRLNHSRQPKTTHPSKALAGMSARQSFYVKGISPK
jgi:hypothetical protein